jgi:hypothetical protein
MPVEANAKACSGVTSPKAYSQASEACGVTMRPDTSRVVAARTPNVE